MLFSFFLKSFLILFEKQQLYWVFWLLYFRAAKPRYALPLAVLPCLIFLLNGLFLRHWLLVFFSVLFAAAHIAITWQNTRAP